MQKAVDPFFIRNLLRFKSAVFKIKNFEMFK